jgi:putative transposase
MSFPRQVLPGQTYLVTRRCTQRQFLLRPDRETNNAFVYCLAYAALKAEVSVVAFVASSNHYHAVITDPHGQIPKFLELFHKLLAKHQNALRRRWENMWSSQQTSLVQLAGPDDVLAKIVYTLANPVKDHLVERAHHWPGASSLSATLSLRPLRARRPTRFFDATGSMPGHLELQCVRAPGFQHLSLEAYQHQLKDLIRGEEAAAAKERKRTNRRILGRKRVLAQPPNSCPDSDVPRRVLSPRLAARASAARIAALKTLKAFRAAYAAARELWLAGAEVLFPEGTWWLRRFASAPCSTAPCTTAISSSDPCSTDPCVT